MNVLIIYVYDYVAVTTDCFFHDLVNFFCSNDEYFFLCVIERVNVYFKRIEYHLFR